MNNPSAERNRIAQGQTETGPRCNVLIAAADAEGSRRIGTWLGGSTVGLWSAQSRDEALAILAAQEIDILVVDVPAVPDAGWVELLRRAKARRADLDAVVVADRPGTETVLDAFRAGAADLIPRAVACTDLPAHVATIRAQRGRRLTAALHAIGRLIVDAEDRVRLPERIVDLAARSMAADEGSLLVPGASGTLSIAYSTVDPCRVSAGGPEIERVARDQRPVLLDGAAGSDPRAPDLGSSRRSRSSIAYPLLSGRRFMGVLTLNRLAGPPFNTADLESAGLLAAEIVLALENSLALRAVMGAEKLASMGQVAAGIVHEINNLLGCILPNIQAGRARLSELMAHGAGSPEAAHRTLGEVQQILSETQDTAGRIVAVVKDMRRLARGDLATTTCDVGDAIDSAVRLARGALRHGVELDVKLQPGLTASGSMSQLSQVLLNLLLNAGDAVTEAPCPAPRISVRTWGEERSVLIAVADNGPGMSPEVAARVFEPFFTTRSDRGGTGLGLSISRDIVRRHGGEIRVRTEVGVGSEFTMVLPRSGTGPRA